MPLVLKREEGETWRDAVKRIAGAQGLAAECLEIYDREAAALPDPHSEDDEGQIAFGALYDWDCLDFVPEIPAHG